MENGTPDAVGGDGSYNVSCCTNAVQRNDTVFRLGPREYLIEYPALFDRATSRPLRVIKADFPNRRSMSHFLNHGWKPAIVSRQRARV